jgi:hypothetical protein
VIRVVAVRDLDMGNVCDEGRARPNRRNLLLGWLARLQGTVRIHCAVFSARLFALWDAWKNKDTAAHNAVVADEIACVSSGDAVVGTMFIADPFERDCRRC